MQRSTHLIRLFLFFLLGAATTTLVLTSIAYLVFSFYYKDRIYPGVKVEGIDLSNQTKPQALSTLSQINSQIPRNAEFLREAHLTSVNLINFVFSSPTATTSASSSDLKLRLDTDLMVNRAYSIGRQTKNPYWNFQQIVVAWQKRINLPLEVSLDESVLNQTLDKISLQIEIPAVNAVFKFDPAAGPDRKGRVIAFSPSKDGLAIDRGKVKQQVVSQTKVRLTQKEPRSEATSPELLAQRTTEGTPTLTIPIYTKTLSPSVKSSTADDLGLKSLLGRGESYFYDSIPGRVYNIGLGTSKINGSLVAPGEIFSFDTAIGTVSAVFGFQKAYAIIKGKTVLDDGGGVCQVSTTLYRAVLNAGLPVLERTAHTYRVGFYEQGGFLPGLDATVYPPSPDLKFRNDTGSYLLIQATTDYNQAKLTFEIFGTDDGRKTTILGPYILSTSPPPDPIYEDDPTLPVGQQKQVDTAHPGAKVYFKRTVTRGQDTLINETVYSDFVPWPARFLKGTKT